METSKASTAYESTNNGGSASVGTMPVPRRADRRLPLTEVCNDTDPRTDTSRGDPSRKVPHAAGDDPASSRRIDSSSPGGSTRSSTASDESPPPPLFDCHGSSEPATGSGSTSKLATTSRSMAKPYRRPSPRSHHSQQSRDHTGALSKPCGAAVGRTR